MTGLQDLADRLLRFETTDGREAAAQDWLRGRLDDLGFETYTWTADPERLAAHPSFPDDPAAIDATDRPSVAGAREFGDPEAGPTLVLNGHVDVVPVDAARWTTDPFAPAWDGDDLTARGAADTKSGLAACVLAAADLDGEGLDGRVVVESVAGEEVGGIGAAAAAVANPYPFERDAALVVEPTDLRPVVATEGCILARLRIEGRSAHAATRWEGESVFPHFERIRRAFRDLEAERADSVTHPLYEGFDLPWPVCFGRVEAGTFGSTVAGSLAADVRLGVAPGETVAGVEAAFRERLDAVAAEDEWLRTHPPTLERMDVQSEPAEIPPDEPVVTALRAGLREAGLDPTPRGATYATDARHYIEAGVPTVVFGPGRIEQAHFPDETVHWPDVERAREIIASTAERLLG